MSEINRSDSAEPAARPSAPPEGAEAAGKHTPGPWYIDEAGICSADEMVAQVCYADDYFGVAEEDIPAAAHARLLANAHLIAAAPEMYEALKQLLAFGRREWALDLEAEMEGVISVADAAIARAEGRPQ